MCQKYPKIMVSSPGAAVPPRSHVDLCLGRTPGPSWKEAASQREAEVGPVQAGIKGCDMLLVGTNLF